MEGTYGNCFAYDQIPHGTWLKLEWLQMDQHYGHYLMRLTARSNENYQLWVEPTMLPELQRYCKLMREERFQDKNIFFKYNGKNTDSFHNFRLIH